MAMATPAVDRLRSSIRVLNCKNDDLLMDFDNILLSAKLVAEEVEKHHDASSVQDLHDATLDIARCAHTLRTYKEALDALAASYQASPEVTDFKTLLKDRVKELDHQSPFDPEKHEFIKQFEEAVWKVHHAGEPMPGQEQEEIVVMAGSQTLPNKACPLSGKPVDQLENPVRSQRCRHIYERDAVLDYVRRHEASMQGRRRIASNACKCAAAGCPGILVEEQLVCDRSLKIEIREYMLRQQSSNVDTVADFTLLEEDDDTPVERVWYSLDLSGFQIRFMRNFTRGLQGGCHCSFSNSEILSASYKAADGLQQCIGVTASTLSAFTSGVTVQFLRRRSSCRTSSLATSAGEYAANFQASIRDKTKIGVELH